MKKISSFILAIAMIISMAFVMNLSPITAHAADANVWDGTTITQPTSMKTIDGVYYYEISTAEELAYIAKTGGDWLGYNYILANDITLNSIELTYDSNGNLTVDTSALNEWTPINNLQGIFDGNGHTIYGVYVNSSTDAAFLVNNDSNQADSCKEVKNLTLSNSYIRGYNAAGICESARQGIANCYFYGAVIGSVSASGICLDTNVATGTGIKNCVNYGDIYGVGRAAGIVNSANGLISNCVNYGSVFSKHSSAAGICNQTNWDGDINNCSNYGFVNGVSKVAGIVSDADTSYIRSCQNAGNIKGASYVGGICGHAQYMNIFSDTAITNSFNTGNIEGAEYIGGICGYVNQAYVDSCYNTGNINGSGNYVGGIIGYLNYGDCKNSTNVGYVTNSNLKSETGALIGHSQSIWGDGVVSGCQYIKTDTVNTKLVAFGNTTTDTDNVISKDASFFCVNSDKTLNKNGHTYSSTVPCDATCDNCGYERTITHTYDNVKYDSDKHWHECDCGEVKPDSEESHTGGTATEDVAETCTECGYIISPALGHKLSGGAIAGIAVGSTAVVGIGGFSLIWFVIKKKSWADLIAIFKKK